jgi:histidyl-tRNA synthetase
MRYDLTVPFARYMAAHVHELYLPFKRYHMAKVFRGENTQRGRYREFVQCDFDVVGTEAVSSDLEIVLLIDAAFRAMDVGGAKIHLAHRGVMNALLASLDAPESAAEETLRIVDKLRKVGEEKVRSMLEALVGSDGAEQVIRFITLSGEPDAILSGMREIAPAGSEHIDRLEEVVNGASEAGIGDRIVIDPSITRGLDYYTGLVFETFLEALPDIGSVCSGGRYDNLAALYSKERMPGVGGSIGLDRLMAALETLGAAGQTPATVDALVLCFADVPTGHYHGIARELREAGLRVDVYPEPKKLGQQFAFAERRQIPFAVICGPDEHASGTVSVRNLASRESAEGLTVEAAAKAIRRG